MNDNIEQQELAIEPEDYIIPDEELNLAKELFSNASVDTNVNVKLNVTKKKDYTIRLNYSGPEMDILKDLANFDTRAWLIVNKLLATVETYKRQEKNNE